MSEAHASTSNFYPLCLSQERVRRRHQAKLPLDSLPQFQLHAGFRAREKPIYHILYMDTGSKLSHFELFEPFVPLDKGGFLLFFSAAPWLPYFTLFTFHWGNPWPPYVGWIPLGL